MTNTVYAGTMVVHTLAGMFVTEATVAALKQYVRPAKRVLDVFSLMLFMVSILLSDRDDAAELFYALGLGLHLARPIAVHFINHPSAAEVMEHVVSVSTILSLLYVVYSSALPGSRASVAEVVVLGVAAALKVWSNLLQN